MKKTRIILGLVFLLILCGVYLALGIFAGSKTIKDTIVVKAGEVYDGGGETIIASGMDADNKNKSPKPIFLLERGAELRNVKIASPGCGGIYCVGDNIIRDVIWEDVGVNAVKIIGDESTGAGNITIEGGEINKTNSDIFDIGVPCKFELIGITIRDFNVVIHQKGFSGNCSISIKDSTFQNGKNIVYTEDEGIDVVLDNNIIDNVIQNWANAKSPTKVNKSVSSVEITDIKPKKVETTKKAMISPNNKRNVEVIYSIQNQWKDGAKVDITIKNISKTKINGWTLSWVFNNGEVITNMWRASYIVHDNKIVSSPLSYNPIILPGHETSFGFTLNSMKGTSKPSNIEFSIKE